MLLSIQLAQPIRLLLEFVGDKYDEQLYDQNDREKWFKEKYSLGFELPNTNIKCVRPFPNSNTFAVGSTPEERATISMIEGALGDLRNGVSRIAYNEKFEELKVDYLKNLPATLRMWSEFLGDKPYLHHSAPSHLDFMFYEALDVLHYLEPTCLDAFPNLSQFMHRVEAIPNIKAYMESDRFIKWPLNGWQALFGGGDAPPS
ncbi:glutathione S-transferase [Paragonimus westermani]|uniref:glutathione transferase n=1 Tax=Paragonimus westermani TaxID=34504 RepID=A0A5J4NGR3_9TREM|nr:glutathione S-transferase [Paragonimus westermani]